MKPYDIYNLWVLFDKMTNDPSFNQDQKIAMGRDMLAALPPEMLCSGSKPSLEAVTAAMQGRLNEYTRSTRETSIRPGTSPLAGATGGVQDRNEGDGLSLANLEHPKKPAKKARSTGHDQSAGKPE